MPQLTLPDAGTDYDLYERLIAQSTGTTAVQSADTIRTSILPRSCSIRSISYPDTAPNTGTSLLIKDANGSEIKKLDASDLETYQVGGGAENRIPLIGILLRGGAANALVDVEVTMN